ncbi:MAG: radical SAM protein [Proteobacteria bacterium]|nr:radical SAM protein [Pseudomonadota bacterium]MBU4259400.1 radical SAM protein [Pseudomonadota bacterium]MBU4288191.1 radical SAM protein [Pseudomonadota bacterium]MBU4415091.1 radical SAM protein [Pseudomonadota bacterium]MCG2757756.1 radical SAM protein [Desulfobacteraceae bacterium]
MQDNATYGFQAHLSPEFPSQIVVDVTEFCNLACIHCPQAEFSKSESFQGRYLGIELHKKLIDEVARDGTGYCKYLRYTAQGEPLLHPKFVNMVEYAANNAGVPINITTNGMLLTEKKVNSLLKAGVDVIDISIDANTPETYARIRKKGDLNIVRKNALRLLEVRRENHYNTRVVVSFVEQPLNKNESADFEKFWKDSGADYVIIRRLHSAGGIKRELVQIDRRRSPCLYPWERLTLSPDEFIHFCPQDWMHGSVVCDFNKNTIKEVWQGEFMRMLREAHLENDFSKHSFCGQCPDWSTTRWPNEGRSYSNMMRESLNNPAVK